MIRMVLSPGSRLGPYEILAPIGAGGMGRGLGPMVEVAFERFGDAKPIQGAARPMAVCRPGARPACRARLRRRIGSHRAASARHADSAGSELQRRCGRFGFPLTYRTWSDQIAELNGKVIGGRTFSTSALVTDLVIALAVALVIFLAVGWPRWRTQHAA
jgi:hypothetical protein